MTTTSLVRCSQAGDSLGHVICRIRNWRLDRLDGANAVTCGTTPACSGTFSWGNPSDNSVSVIGAATGVQVTAGQAASAGSSTLSVPLSVGTFTALVGHHSCHALHDAFYLINALLLAMQSSAACLVLLRAKFTR